MSYSKTFHMFILLSASKNINSVWRNQCKCKGCVGTCLLVVPLVGLSWCGGKKQFAPFPPTVAVPILRVCSVATGGTICPMFKLLVQVERFFGRESATSCKSMNFCLLGGQFKRASVSGFFSQFCGKMQQKPAWHDKNNFEQRAYIVTMDSLQIPGEIFDRHGFKIEEDDNSRVDTPCFCTGNVSSPVPLTVRNEYVMLCIRMH